MADQRDPSVIFFLPFERHRVSHSLSEIHFKLILKNNL
jgi:hypothetical protein